MLLYTFILCMDGVLYGWGCVRMGFCTDGVLYGWGFVGLEIL